MNYNQKYYNEIFEKMLNDSVENGLISRAEDFQSYINNRDDISNYYVMDKSVIAEMFSTVYEDLTNVYNRVDVALATGKDLDNLGDLVGIIRPSATYAMTVLTFTANSGVTDDISYDENILVESRNGITYRTLEKVNIPEGVSSCDVQAIATVPGTRSRVSAGVLTNIITPNIIDVSVTNPSASNGGVDEYNDDDYRQLILAWSLIYLRGSLEAYESYFSNFDGIDGYKLVPNWDGTGTMKIVLDPGTDYQLNRAYNEIQTSVVQATEAVVLTSPEKVPIDISAVVNIDIDQINPYSDIEKDNVKANIRKSIVTFIDGGDRLNGGYYPGLMIGEDFIPHKLAVFLDEEINELKNIQFYYPDDYVRILDDEIGVANNISIEMI